jgi:hypothetical protein
MDLLFPQPPGDRTDIVSTLTEIHGVHMVSVERCPVTGRIIPPVEVMAEAMAEFVEVKPELLAKSAILAVAEDIRRRALKSGIPAAVIHFEFLSKHAVIMAREDEQNGNDQRRDSSDDSDAERLHEGSGVRGIGGEILSGTAERSEEHNGGSEDGPGEGGEIVALPSRRGSHKGLSRRVVEEELEEHRKDLAAFSGSYSLIKNRVRDVRDEGRLMKLVEWSGTAAVMGTLELSIHAIENVIGELRDLLKRIDAGAIPNLDEEEHV